MKGDSLSCALLLEALVAVTLLWHIVHVESTDPPIDPLPSCPLFDNPAVVIEESCSLMATVTINNQDSSIMGVGDARPVIDGMYSGRLFTVNTNVNVSWITLTRGGSQGNPGTYDGGAWSVGGGEGIT